MKKHNRNMSLIIVILIFIGVIFAFKIVIDNAMKKSNMFY